MSEIFAHITVQEVPSMWLAALAGFLGGVAFVYAMLARKTK